MNTLVFLSVIDVSSLSFLCAAFIFVKLHLLFSKPNDDHCELSDAAQFGTLIKLIIIKRTLRVPSKVKMIFLGS